MKRVPESPKSRAAALPPPELLAGYIVSVEPLKVKKVSSLPINNLPATAPILPTVVPSFAKVAMVPSSVVLLK